MSFGRSRRRWAASLAFWLLASLSAFGQELVPGKVNLWTAPLERIERRSVSGPGHPFPGDARIGIVVPDGFSPDGFYPVLFVSVTGDRFRTNLEELEAYWPVAVKRGWVVLTAEGEKWPKRRSDTIAFRKTYYRAAMRVLNERIPSSKEWPLVFGGFSGGSKMSQYLAAYGLSRGHRVLGVFAAGCNENRAEDALRRYEANPAEYYSLGFFFCTGNKDTMSTVAQSERVMESLRQSGAMNLGSHWFEGAHIHSSEGLDRGLSWFEELFESKRSNI